jgi:hypothetical protein
VLFRKGTKYSYEISAGRSAVVGEERCLSSKSSGSTDAGTAKTQQIAAGGVGIRAVANDLTACLHLDSYRANGDLQCEADIDGGSTW